MHIVKSIALQARPARLISTVCSNGDRFTAAISVHAILEVPFYIINSFYKVAGSTNALFSSVSPVYTNSEKKNSFMLFLLFIFSHCLKAHTYTQPHTHISCNLL